VSGDGFELLRGLPALRALELLHLEEFPACLSSLASLESLAIGSYHNNTFTTLAAALPSLSLTQLVLIRGTPDVFAALTSQTRLRDFSCQQTYWRAGELVGLVGGAWLHSLRRLGLSAELLEASMPALAHATCLETVQVLYVEHSEQLEPVLHWAVQRPALRRLDLRSVYGYSDRGLSSTDWNAILRAQARRPDLRMRIPKPEWDLHEEFLAADDED
jgi:hypothetical protein